MPKRPAHLPEFEAPPVVEVALGVQFATLSAFRTIHAGYLRDVFKKDFQKCIEQPPLSPAFETFGSRTGEEAVARLEVLPGAPIPRLWFLNQEETQLIQFQSDRFIHNWRKVGEGASYPRYETIRAKFFDELKKIDNFLEYEDIGEIVPNQCEVTYVNHIPSVDDENLVSDMASVFSIWGSKLQTIQLSPPEDGRFSFRYIIHSEDKKPIGRLIISAEPVQSPNNESMIRLTLMARGRPEEPSIDMISKFFDMGRDKIVQSFAEITTKKMHTRWRKA